MIDRCPLGLPIRYRDDGTIDFTDSAFLTGMLSLLGSTQEKPWMYAIAERMLRLEKALGEAKETMKAVVYEHPYFSLEQERLGNKAIVDGCLMRIDAILKGEKK